MFAALGRFVHKRRSVIVLAWAVAFVAGLVATSHLPGELKGGGFTNPATPSQRAQKAMQERLGFGPAQLTIVFASPDLDARGPAFQAQIEAALAGIDREAFPQLLTVRTAASTGDAGFISADRHATFAVLSFDASTEQVQRMIPAVRARLAPTNLTTYLTGDPAVYADLEKISAEDLRTAETYALPIAVIVLVLVFGTLVAAALPVIGGGMAVTVSLGLFWVLAQILDLSVFAMNVATLIGLAVGIDYSLFMVGRFREELGAGRTVAQAVETTVEYAGRSIFFSGVTVMVGLLGLVAIPFMSMQSVGLGGALVVIVSVLAALTLLPALLGMLGPRVDRLRIIGRAGKQGAFWGRWSDAVMRHPVPVLIGTLIVVLLFAWPVLHIEREIAGATALPQRSESRQGYDILRSRFDLAALSPIYVLATWAGGTGALEPANLRRLFEYGVRLRAMSGVARVTSIVNLPGVETPAAAGRLWRAVQRPVRTGQPSAGAGLPGLLQGLLGAQQREAALRLRALTTAPGTALFLVVPKDDPSSVGAQDLARRIYHAPPTEGMTVLVGGTSMSVYDFVHALYQRFPWVILFVVCVTALVLLLLLRSVVLPVKAVAMNVLSLLAGYGAVVWIFQDGHLEGLFGFHSSGAIEAELPVILFCTVFGVSMDYEVFLLSRMREAWDETGDNLQAVRFGLARTGRIVTSAALIIVVVGGSFAFTSLLVTKAIGVGLAVAVAVDASVVRILMVPAFMRLLGRWNWWLPGWLDRRLPRIE
ncbi:MAG: MMPL family transporter [Actinobacteria bacterium]|nr:MMPL family transporter [Actinomycetota bacterium]